MKGYKALDQEMRACCGNYMQYELGKTYSVDGEVILCRNGFHFCERIEHLNHCYDISDSRIFEVEADGVIISEDHMYVAEKIELLRELGKEEIREYFEQNLQDFICNAACHVRQAVAKLGYGLDTLVSDKDWRVRWAVAKRGYGLDILVKDEEWVVREAVAEQGYGLNILIGDECESVRQAAEEASQRNKAHEML